MTILYQNNKTGDAHDITPLVAAAKWTTVRRGAPASLELTVLAHTSIAWEHGGILALKDGETGLFYGYVFKISRDMGGKVVVTAYDQVRYLKNKETYVFTGKRADEILAAIAADFELEVGELANTGYAIPSMIKDGETLLDTVLEALDWTLINTGRMFYLWDDFGKLRISDVEQSKLDLVLGDSSLVTGYTYESDIDAETYNKIKLVRDNEASGKRDVWIFLDSETMRLWGTLQNYETVADALNEAQIKERGEKMLELYNRPQRSFELTAIEPDLTVRGGRALFIQIGELGLGQFFIIEEAVHDLLARKANIKLKVV